MISKGFYFSSKIEKNKGDMQGLQKGIEFSQRECSLPMQIRSRNSI